MVWFPNFLSIFRLEGAKDWRCKNGTACQGILESKGTSIEPQLNTLLRLSNQSFLERSQSNTLIHSLTFKMLMNSFFVVGFPWISSTNVSLLWHNTKVTVSATTTVDYKFTDIWRMTSCRIHWGNETLLETAEVNHNLCSWILEFAPTRCSLPDCDYHKNEFDETTYAQWLSHKPSLLISTICF